MPPCPKEDARLAFKDDVRLLAIAQQLQREPELHEVGGQNERRGRQADVFCCAPLLIPPPPNTKKENTRFPLPLTNPWVFPMNIN